LGCAPFVKPITLTHKHLERKQASEAVAQQQTAAKRAANETLTERPAKTAKGTTTGVIPDEYLPPNKTLFVRDLPDDYSQDNLTLIFSRFPGLKAARLVPGRVGIAFVEYEDENAAINAKEATTGMTLGENTIRVTFRRA
jgi:U2 small nuclear ribonucleoprotein B''